MTKITILAEDIRTSDFFNPKDCAITRALHRAGFPNYHHSGIEIMSGQDTVLEETPELRSLTHRVLHMYESLVGDGSMSEIVEEPQDFTVELPI